MLSRLDISNYALIDHVVIEFNKGLTIITGETGAGKSIIMGALSLILGERADIKSIRDKEKKSVIEATFDIRDYDLKDFFEENDIDYFPEECILRKEFSASGRSRAFINDSPVSVGLMKELSINLIDIHSQHSNLLISKQSYQLSVIDNLVGNSSLLSTYKTKYKEYLAAKKELDNSERDYRKSKDEEDYIRFQLNQLKPLKLVPGEDVALEGEQKKLSNLSEIKESLWTADDMLNGEDNSIISGLRTAIKSLSNASEYMESLSDCVERLESTLIELKDLSSVISSRQEGLDCDPTELDRINERLNTIYSLETKHGVRSVDELLRFQCELEEKIEKIDNSDEHINALRAKSDKLYNECMHLASDLSKQRKDVAKKFAQELTLLCAPLGLKNMHFEVSFTSQELSSTGSDSVNYMVAFNKKQALMPVEATASGGELSRLMLSIKTIIAKCMNLPTIIFDEVDTGVSGDVAAKIGEMMKELSQRIQVIAITHLPQVAALGNNHIKVFKTDVEDATITSVKQLDSTERINEIAGMLSGSEITHSAIENAKALLKNNLN